MFDAKIYITRREKLEREVRSGLALFLGNEESPMNYMDNGYRFRQDSTFLYYFGLDQAGLAAVIDLDEGSETIYGNDLTLDDFVWMGPQPTVHERAKAAGISKTGDSAALVKALKAAKAAGRRIHFLPPYREANAIKLMDWLGVDPAKARAEASVELIKAIVEQRNIKAPEEIAEIEAAVNTSVDMHVAAMRMARPGVNEAQVAAEVHRIALAAGGDIAFPIIATIHGETLHNHYQGNVMKEGDLFLLDAGAETRLGYAGDLSSTSPISGKFTPKQKEIFEICLSAHRAAVAALKPGVNHRDVHLTACRTMSAGLKELGLMKGDTDEAVRQGAHAMFFPCGVGHMMGLDVHDMEDLGEIYVGYEGRPERSTQFGLKSLRLARPLKPGFVLTIEPGIYFIPELIRQWKAAGKFTEFLNYEKIETYKDFGGLRNEENYLITADGKRRLGKPKPMTIAEVEAIAGH